MNHIFPVRTVNKRLHKDWLPTLQNFNETHKQIEKKEEGRRKEKTLINEQASQSRKRRENGWPSWMDVRGCRVGTEVDEEQGGRAHETAGHCARTPGTGRHTQTHSLIHTLTRPCTQAHASAHCHTDLCWHLGGQPHLQSSPGCRNWSTLSTSVHLTSEIEPLQRFSLPVDWTEFSGPSFTTPGIPTDLH